MAEFNLKNVFNEASKKEIEKEKEKGFFIKQIDVDDLIPNELNFYEISDIEELKNSISQFGVKQNLEVERLENGKFKIISGERRYTATKELVAEGREDLRKLPCRVLYFDGFKIKNDSGEEIEIDENIYKKWILRTTNEEQRKKTDGEIMREIQEQKELYDYLSSNGIEIKGSKRKIIAKDMGISESQIQRYEFIDKNLDEDLKEDFTNDKIPLKSAVDIAREPQEIQEIVKEKIKDKDEVTTKDVENIITNEKIKQKIEEQKELNNKEIVVSTKEIDDIQETMQIVIRVLKEGKTLKKSEHTKYIASLERIERELGKIEKLL